MNKQNKEGAINMPFCEGSHSLLQPIEPQKISSLSDLCIRIVESNKGGNKWFRGQASSDFALIPRARRDTYIIADQHGRVVRPTKVTDYGIWGNTVISPYEDLDTLSSRMEKADLLPNKSQMSRYDINCLAQHYGFRTNLLDWSTDASVALFFTQYHRKKGEPAALFILNPTQLNYKMVLEKRILTSKEANSRANGLPFAAYGSKDNDNKRICRQSGNFTVHGSIIWPLDYYPVANDYLVKLELSDAVCDELKSALDGFGINHNSIFIEKDKKDKIAETLNDEIESKFKEIIQRKTEEFENTPKNDRGCNTYN